MDRVDKLAKAFLELLKKYEELSFVEQQQVYRKVGWPSRINLRRVKEPTNQDDQKSPEDIDDINIEAILRIPEIGSEEKRKELFESLNQRGIKFDDLTEFVFFHARPKWFDSSETIPEGEHLYIGEVLFDDVISVHIQYDRAKMIEFLKDVLLVEAIEQDSLEKGTNIVQVFLPLMARERGDNFDRVMINTVSIWGAAKGEDEFREPVRVSAANIKKSINPDAGIFQDIEYFDKVLSVEAELAISSFLTEHIGLGLRSFFIDLIKAALSEDGKVSAEEYRRISRIPFTFVRPRGSGGAYNARYKLSAEDRNKLNAEYNRLKEDFEPLRRDYKYFSKDKRGDWRKLIQDRYGLPLDMIEKLPDPDHITYTPSNLAAELAARCCIANYKDWSLTAKRIKELAKPPG